MFNRGHILTLGGYWDADLLDELEHGLNGLRQVLPRTRGQKHITLHLFNFSLTADAVSIALSLVRRTFIEDTTQVAVVAEGSLQEAGFLFLIGSQRGYRKVFIDATVELSLRNNPQRTAGFNSPNHTTEPKVPIELRLLPSDWQTRVILGEQINPNVLELPQLGLVDKLLPRR